MPKTSYKSFEKMRNKKELVSDVLGLASRVINPRAPKAAKKKKMIPSMMPKLKVKLTPLGKKKKNKK